MAQNAIMKFNHALYSKLKGALAFYNNLKQQQQQQPSHPTPLQIVALLFRRS
jgi:hypothetical protein